MDRQSRGGLATDGDGHLARIGKLAASTHDAMSVYARALRLIVTSTMLSAVVQASSVLQVGLLGHAIGLDVPWAVYGVAAPMVTLLTLLPISLTGMGVREWGMVLFLAPLGVRRGGRDHRGLPLVFNADGGEPGRGRLLPVRPVSPPRGADDDEIVGRDSDQGRTGQPRRRCMSDCTAVAPAGRRGTTRSSSSTTAAADGSFALLEELAARDASRQGGAPAPQLRPVGRPAGRHRLVPPATSSSPWTATCKTTRPTFPRCSTKLDEGYDAVLGLRANRQDHFVIRKLPSLMANWLIRKVTGVADQGHGLHAAGHAPRPGRVAAALRRDAPLRPGAGCSSRALALAQVPVRHHPRRPARPSTT